jgi:hypothetical protein
VSQSGNRIRLGTFTLRKLRIGYLPFSKDLKHPGDRRRLVYWAKHRGHQIVTDLTENVDVLVISERGDLGITSRVKKGPPIVFDLIDGYLAQENFAIDWMRGTSKVLTGKISGAPEKFTSIISKLCVASSAVICSSVEQESRILPFSNNIHVILDSHDEISFLPYKSQEGNQKQEILWEGLPATMGGLREIQSALEKVLIANDVELNLVSDLQYFKVLGSYMPAKTHVLLKKSLGEAYSNTRLVPWSVDNLTKFAMQSSASIIPVRLSSPLQFLKPENRLLIMWRLGLPCLTSNLPSYIRVNEIAGVDGICDTLESWSSKLELVLGNDRLREDMVHRGQSYLKEFHNTDVLLEKWDRAIYSVL